MTTQDSFSFGRVWDAIETSPAQAGDMAQRSELCCILLGHVRRQRWTSDEAARQMGVSPEIVSALFAGDIDALDITTLELMRNTAGLARSG